MGGALAFSGFPEGFLTERRDGVEVLLGLRGQADHEIKLDETPSGGKDLLNGLEKIGLGVSFVDDPAQPLGPRLHGEREAGFPDFLDLVNQGGGQSFDAEGRERDRHLHPAVAVDDEREQRFDCGVVPRAQGEKGNFVVAGGVQTFFKDFEDFFRGPFPQGAVNHPGLAEAAAPGAAPGDFDVQAVVNHLQKRQDRTVRKGAQIRGPRAPSGGRRGDFLPKEGSARSFHRFDRSRENKKEHTLLPGGKAF